MVSISGFSSENQYFVIGKVEILDREYVLIDVVPEFLFLHGDWFVLEYCSYKDSIIRVKSFYGNDASRIPRVGKRYNLELTPVPNDSDRAAHLPNSED